MTIALELLGIAFMSYVIAKLLGFPRKVKDIYQEGDPLYSKQIYYKPTFVGETLFGFKVPYTLELRFDRVDDEQFKLKKMLDETSQHSLAMSFNTNRIRRLLSVRSWFFNLHCDVGQTRTADKAICLTVCGLFEEEGRSYIREVPNWKVVDEVKKESFTGSGCEVVLQHLDPGIFSPEIIEENYAMLKREDIEEIRKSDRYGEYEEMLAVAALKRRLDFLGNKKQSYENDYISIETESAGRALKIRWSFKSPARPNYEIRAYRKTGGFSGDQWNEESNGTLVIDSKKDGEVIEHLNEGEANFYTVWVRPINELERKDRSSALRFQATIATREETEAIQGVMKRIEERSFSDSGRHNISRAVHELGLAVELDRMMTQAEKNAVSRIGSDSAYTEEEKKEKIERVLEMVANLKDKYSV